MLSLETQTPSHSGESRNLINKEMDPGFRRGDGLIKLEDVVTPRSVPNGFYVAQGATAAVPRVLDHVVKLFHLESKTSTFSGSKASRVGRLFWVDSGNSFNAYYVAHSAAKWGLNPRRLLRAVNIARPFTAFQLQQMLEKIPAGTFRPLVIISDLMGLFYDPEIPEHDAHRSFHRFVSGIMKLQERAVVLGLLHQEVAPPSRRAFLPRLLALSSSNGFIEDPVSLNVLTTLDPRQRHSGMTAKNAA